MPELSEQDLIDQVKFTKRVPSTRRGRTTSNPWAPTVDKLIEQYRSTGESDTAEFTLPNATPGEQAIVTKQVNRIRSLGQSPERKDVSIRVAQEPQANKTVVVSVRITEKVAAGRPSGK